MKPGRKHSHSFSKCSFSIVWKMLPAKGTEPVLWHRPPCCTHCSPNWLVGLQSTLPSECYWIYCRKVVLITYKNYRNHRRPEAETFEVLWVLSIQVPPVHMPPHNKVLSLRLAVFVQGVTQLLTKPLSPNWLHQKQSEVPHMQLSKWVLSDECKAVPQLLCET